MTIIMLLAASVFLLGTSRLFTQQRPACAEPATLRSGLKRLLYRRSIDT